MLLEIKQMPWKHKRLKKRGIQSHRWRRVFRISSHPPFWQRVEAGQEAVGFRVKRVSYVVDMRYLIMRRPDRRLLQYSRRLPSSFGYFAAREINWDFS